MTGKAIGHMGTLRSPDRRIAQGLVVSLTPNDFRALCKANNLNLNLDPWELFSAFHGTACVSVAQSFKQGEIKQNFSMIMLRDRETSQDRCKP